MKKQIIKFVGFITLFFSSVGAHLSYAAAEKTAENAELVTIESAFDPDRVTNSVWSDLEVKPDFFANPYRISIFDEQHGEDSDRLWSQTKTIFGLGLGVAGFIALLPEDISNWHRSKDNSLAQKWWNNVKEGPYWDRDKHYINYIGHPYFGGVYYQIARKSGYRQWDAFIYSSLMSTFYWEYGVEAFAEVPSVQDLVVTPVAGWVFGEWMFHQEQAIRSQGGTAMDSEFLGDLALFFLDPVDSIGRGINSLFDKDIIKAGTGTISFKQQVMPDGVSTDDIVQLNFSYQFDVDNKPADKGLSINSVSTKSSISRDPVDTGIVGVSMGVGYGRFDAEWNIDNSYYSTASIGLYFSPQFSASLSYAATHLNEKVSGTQFRWENYNISGQFYFNEKNRLRPYIAVGIGEMLRDEDNDAKTFQSHLGTGLYYKLNSNWAVQADWRIWYSSRFQRIENTVDSHIIYRFGGGER